jgi:hypothetical protein
MHLCHAVLCAAAHAALRCTVSHPTAPCSDCAMLHHCVLCRAVLCCAVLHSDVPCWAAPHRQPQYCHELPQPQLLLTHNAAHHRTSRHHELQAAAAQAAAAAAVFTTGQQVSRPCTRVHAPLLFLLLSLPSCTEMAVLLVAAASIAHRTQHQ